MQLLKKIIPKSILKRLRSFYGFLKFGIGGYFAKPKFSYSQRAEDILVFNESIRMKIKNGYYCDIGSYHPKFMSNTHILDKAGWTGTVIDIDEKKLLEFKRYRKNKVLCVKGAVVGSARKNQTQPVYMFNNDMGWSDINTLDLEIAKLHKKNGAGDFFEDEVEVIDINELLKSLPHINFLNIDVEGLDEQIILSINFDLYQPDIICFEDIKLWGGSNDIYKKLTCYGYERFFIAGESIGYSKIA